MKTLTIKRGDSENAGTFGIAIADDGASWHSLEPPDNGNQPDISCIPPGTYQAILQYSPHFSRELYHLQNVPARTYVMIHEGNFGGVGEGLQTDTDGCILLGKSLGKLINKYHNEQDVIIASHEAIAEFMEWAGQDPIQVIIY